MTHYIDFPEEEENCKHCDAPDNSYHGYCCRACYKYDVD